MSKVRRYKKKEFNKKPWIISAAVALGITVCLVIAVIISNNTRVTDEASPDNAATVDTAATVDEVIEETVEQTKEPTAPTVEETVALQSQPEQLTQLLSRGSQSYDTLSMYGCTQLVTVTANGVDAQIQFYECIDGLWVENSSLNCNGYVGYMGAVDNMSEDISGTPRGLYGIGSAFYRNTCPNTKLDVFEITQDTYWVDDPDSKYYNQRVEGTAYKDWDSAEHMVDYSEYDYGFVVNYNMPPKYNAGSAIFFHIGDGPTAGCIATSENMVLNYLSKLDKASNPYILIN